MTKKRNLQAVSFILVFALVIGLMPIPIYANDVGTCPVDEPNYESNIETTDEDIAELKNLLNIVDTYIDKNGSAYFDEESAIIQNESEDIIAIGQAYNEMILADLQGDNEHNSRIKRAIINGLTHYGNWCVKGNNGTPPIDILDAQCQKHDKCYATNGQWNTNCDIQFVHNIARNFGAIKALGTYNRNYAVAAIMVFAAKAGGTTALKYKYPMLAPFLP